MGAGHREDHYAQDAGEAYLAWQLQLLAESSGRSISKSASELGFAFDNYVDSRGARGDFEESIYKTNIDCTVEGIFREIVSCFPDELFDFIDVEKEFRDKKKKGDFVIRLIQRGPVSVSVKNYKKGFKRIQLCSGTWNSFLNNFIFEPAGVGSFIDPVSGEKFSGSDRDKRDRLVAQSGLSSLLEIYQFIDQTNDEIRSFYLEGEEAAMWSNVENRWKRDCATYGSEASRRLQAAMNELDQEILKRRLLVMSGLVFDEELLLIGKQEFLFSLTDERYRSMLERANDRASRVLISARGQSLKFTIVDRVGVEIVQIDVPFTLQKNGAWHLPRERYAGTRYHPKEGVELAYGERRPKKSRELATSTNTYLDLGRLGLV